MAEPQVSLLGSLFLYHITVCPLQRTGRAGALEEAVHVGAEL